MNKLRAYKVDTRIGDIMMSEGITDQDSRPGFGVGCDACLLTYYGVCTWRSSRTIADWASNSILAGIVFWLVLSVPDGRVHCVVLKTQYCKPSFFVSYDDQTAH